MIWQDFKGRAFSFRLPEFFSRRLALSGSIGLLSSACIAIDQSLTRLIHNEEI